MDPNILVLCMFLLFVIPLFAQVPIALCLGFAAMFYIGFSPSLSMIQAATSMFSAVDSFPLMAVPLFILCGAIIDGGGSRKALGQLLCFLRWPGDWWLCYGYCYHLRFLPALFPVLPWPP